MSWSDVLLILGGLGAGFLSGTIGIGGGLLFVPTMTIGFGLSQAVAQGTSLVAIIPIAIAALPIYYFRKGSPQVDLHVAVFLVVGSVVGAYAGARLLRRIPERELKIAVALVLGVVGIKELLLP